MAWMGGIKIQESNVDTTFQAFRLWVGGEGGMAWMGVGKKNPRQDSRYYIARRTNTTFRFRSRP